MEISMCSITLQTTTILGKNTFYVKGVNKKDTLVYWSQHSQRYNMYAYNSETDYQ